MVWAGMARGTSLADYEKLIACPRVVFTEDPAYLIGTQEYRISCGFEPIKLNKAADFTGEWTLNECESDAMPNTGPSTGMPYKLIVRQADNNLSIKAFSVVEWADDEVMEQSLTLDGKDNQSVVFMNSPRIQQANWSDEKDTLIIGSKVSFKFGEQSVEIKSKEVWTLQKRGKKLVIIRTADGFMGRGPSTIKLVYGKH